MAFVKSIEVRVASHKGDRPEDMVEEVDGNSPDINYHFGGKYVYLYATKTTDPARAATGFVFVKGRQRLDLGQDLAVGTGGAYRYLVTRHDTSERPVPWGAVALWRSSKHITPDTKGWTNWSEDLNQGRNKDYLYVCWNLTDRPSVRVEPVEYVKSIEVHVGDGKGDFPADMVNEVDYKNPDINYTFGGKYVYLYTTKTTEKKQAATGFKFVKNKSSQPHLGKDLAVGAGGAYRYIQTQHDSGAQPVLWGRVALFRSDSHGVMPDKQRWTDWSEDLNKGRSGAYLYVCWKTADD